MTLLYQITFRCRICGKEHRITIPGDWSGDAVLYKLSNLITAPCPDCGSSSDTWILTGIKRVVTNI